MSAADIFQLQQPLTEGGIRSVNFFNGRLLTSKDLSREQAARRAADERLGLALGEGVAWGLQVESDKERSKPGLPVVSVKAGLAFNRQGQTLRLTEDVQVALARRFEASTADCLFANCSGLGGGQYVAGAGVYILTIAPIGTSEGKAPTNGLDPANVRCNTDATVEAVQFRLLWVKRNLYPDLDIAASSFRNELAYRCFGAGIQPAWVANLLDAEPRKDDLVEALRKSVLSDLDVPLGLLYFTGAAELQFLDLWAVRRPLARADDNALGGLVEARRPAVGQAMFRQFQEQITSLAPPSGDLGPVTARSHFRYLPPVGIIPVAEEPDSLLDTMATRFFKDMTYRGPAYINGARLEALLRQSMDYPPIDTQNREMVWLYRVRENRRMIDVAKETGALGPRSYLVFSSAHLPYQADAQFELAYSNYSNFGSVV